MLILTIFILPIVVISYRRLSILHRNYNAFSSKNPFNFEVSADIPLSSAISELPDSFVDAVKRSVKLTLDSISQGNLKCRIDFDTSVGDQTYTSLKNTMPMLKDFVNIISVEYALFPLREKGVPGTVSEVVSEPSDTQPRLLKIFFPDMGAAALVRRDWKLGTNLTEVHPCIRTANIQNDIITSDDKLVILLCPQSSEVESVGRVIDLCAASNVPCVMINPSLINMDQGFGVRARNIRKILLGSFEMTYKLKTLASGALVREWPKGYSIWNEDAMAPEGYKHLQTYAIDPPTDTIQELYDAANSAGDEGKSKVAPSKPNVAVNLVKGVTGFFQGLSRL